MVMLISCFLLQAGLVDFLSSAESSTVRVKPDESAEPAEPAEAEGRPSAAELGKTAVTDKLCSAEGRSWAEPAEPLKAKGRPSAAGPMPGVLMDTCLRTTGCSCTKPREPAKAEGRPSAAEPTAAAGRSRAELAEPAEAEGRPSAAELVEAGMADVLLPVTSGSCTKTAESAEPAAAADCPSVAEPAGPADGARTGLAGNILFADGPAEGLPSACGLCTPKDGKPSAAVPGLKSGSNDPNSSLG